ncbi:mechanosensitive ion channel family protein [Aliivibrio fischeri]|uniref:mechanosensitive ion channel family protein n=1 Tax=Aliivibrio fischeri TaxID=668 RepID=UPI001061013F|nr:mechanosensitive ion channel family protein [Aliivibrio fischeri]TDM52341.1 mechanosensitive ion channel family protein [Aliivibrio fischeri]
MLDLRIRNYVTDKLNVFGFHDEPYGVELAIVVTVIVISVSIGYLITRYAIVKIVNNILHKTNESLFLYLSSHKVGQKLTVLVPIIVFDLLFPFALGYNTQLAHITDKLLSILIVTIFTSMLFSLLDALNDMATSKDVTRRMPIKSLVQLIKLFAFIICIILCLAIFIEESPVVFLSGLGVATGFVMLAFKDTILGFVAGMQLSLNRMVGLNEWIEMDEYKANGTVEEISLTTVKIRNFDNTVSMLPAYALVQNAFVNWQGMSDSGGRRIKRAVNIDVNSIRFMTDDEIESLKSIRILREYLFEKSSEINTFNEEVDDIPHVCNVRQMTNVGIFRAYLTAYLRTHRNIHSHMLSMVRQLEPTQEGLPLQVYAFTNNPSWAFYESVQADIFDHIYAIMPWFNLRPYQALSGHDALTLASSNPQHLS